MKFNKDDIINKIKDFSDKISDGVSSVLNNIPQFFSSHGIAAYAAALSAAVLIIFIIILSFSGGDKKPESTENSAEYILTDDLLIPQEPVYPDEFIPVRNPQQNWSEKEISRWFLEPDTLLLNQIDDKNTKIIEKILEAAP